jgi:predicted nucleotidyltransferase
MKAREGDILKDLSGTIFDVKGLHHPPNKVIAFPRFIPDFQGNRAHENFTYSKIYSISERFKFLEQNLPQLIVYDPVLDEKLCEVPFKNVKRHYKPIDRLRELRRSDGLDNIEKDALSFLEALKSKADIPWSEIGISGSLLVKLHTPISDIDPIIYGIQNCRKAYEALKSLQKDDKSVVKPYSMKDLKRLFRFRSQDTMMSFEDFVRTESRKVMQGKFKGRDYFLRFVKDWKEIGEVYGEVLYRNVGYARVKAEVEDDSEAIFTPCSYTVRNVTVLEGTCEYAIKEVVSFRGRFCEQARTGEVIVAQGKVERVIDKKRNREYFRLLLGNKPSDFMALA